MAGTGSNQRSLARRLSALHAANFAGMGIFLPFFPAWLAGRGFAETEIGLLLALPMVLRALVAAPITALADGWLGPVRLLGILQVASAMVFVALPWTTGLASVAGALVLLAVFGAAIIPTADHLTTAHQRQHPGLDYGRLRLWGSVSFLVMSIAGGAGLHWFGSGSVPWIMTCCALVAAAVVRACPDPATSVPSAPRAIKPGASPGGTRLGTALWLTILAGALINGSHAMIYGFGTLHWRSIGIGDQTIGWLWATGVICEIALMWSLGHWVTRGLGAGWLVGLGGVAAALRFAVMALEPPLAVQFLLQGLHAFSFAAQWLGTLAALTALAPATRRAGAQGMMTTVNAATMALMTLVSGWLNSTLGSAAFAVMALPALAGTGVMAAMLARQRRLDTRPARA